MLLQQTPAPSGFVQLLPLIFIGLIFYVIVFLPARKRQKKVQEMVNSLKSGDRVITQGGIHGTVVGLKGERLHLRVADNVKIEISKTAVASLEGSEDGS